MPCCLHPLPRPGLRFEATGQPPTAGSAGRSLRAAAGSPVMAEWGGGESWPGVVWWGGIRGRGQGHLWRPQGWPDHVQLSSATYLGSQAIRWVAVQVSFLSNEDVLAAERMESVSGSVWWVAEVDSTPPPREEPAGGSSSEPGSLPRAAQTVGLLQGLQGDG